MKDFEQILIDASKFASEKMLEVKKRKDYFVDTKGDSLSKESSILTRADIETEKALALFFTEKMPEYNFLGEESGNRNVNVSKIIVSDPIDCTLGFTQNLANFGTIIGIYDNGINVAGSECNAVTGTIYVATLKAGFKRYGPEDDAAENTIYLEAPNNLKEVFGEKEGTELNDRIASAFREAFQGVNFVIHKPNVLNKCRVFSGRYLGLFHATWSRHDLAAAPILAATTGSHLSDHTGTRFEPVDFLEEFKKYATKSNRVIYSLPAVIAKDREVYEKMLQVLSEFERELNKVRNPKY